MQSASKLRKSFRFLNLNRACLLCSQGSSSLICCHCLESIQFFDFELCKGNLMNLPQVNSGLTGCKFERLLALGDYQWPLSHLLSKLKFSQQLSCAKAIATLFTDTLTLSLENRPDLLLPVPLGSSRFASRKFNQAFEIAKYIGNISGIPVEMNAIERAKNTLPQSSLNAGQRQRNLKNAFELIKPIKARRVALIDDVVTTGATTNALYSLLKTHHPDLQIEVWAGCVTLSR